MVQLVPPYNLNPWLNWKPPLQLNQIGKHIIEMQICRWFAKIANQFTCVETVIVFVCFRVYMHGMHITK